MEAIPKTADRVLTIIQRTGGIESWSYEYTENDCLFYSADGFKELMEALCAGMREIGDRPALRVEYRYSDPEDDSEEEGDNWNEDKLDINVEVNGYNESDHRSDSKDTVAKAPLGTEERHADILARISNLKSRILGDPA